MDNLQKLKSEKKIAKLISNITHPPVVSIPTFAIINIIILGFKNSLTITDMLDIWRVYPYYNIVNSNKENAYRYGYN